MPVGERPYILLSCGMSIDGYLDGATEQRLLLSNDADFDRVDAVRAVCDAILVGAMTVRRDNPRLLVRSRARQVERAKQGLRPTPSKVTVTASGQLDPCANFFTSGDTEKIVYCASAAAADLRDRLGQVATVVDGGQPVDFHRLAEDLHARGVNRLMVEGGGTMHTQFLIAGLADELHLVVAPFFVGNSHARRFVSDGEFPWNADRRATLAEVRQIEDVVLLRYALSARFDPSIGKAT
jgi:riboflavin-specific deaminase-like protein